MVVEKQTYKSKTVDFGAHVAGDGSSQKPFATIGQVLSIVKAGDTVSVD
jgi:hypothetical protein